jgi:hypothetical protein
MKRFKATRLALTVGIAAAAGSSQALQLFEFSEVCTGETPGGSPPWAMLAIEDFGANTVRFTLTHSATSAAGQFLTRLEVFANPLPGDIAAGALDQYVDAILFGVGSDAGYTYNIEFQLDNAPPPDRMLPGATMIQTLTGTGLDETDFEPMAGPNAGVFALLHLQGIATGEGSAKLCGMAVPEPSTMVALAVGGILLLARRRK